MHGRTSTSLPSANIFTLILTNTEIRSMNFYNMKPHKYCNNNKTIKFTILFSAYFFIVLLMLKITNKQKIHRVNIVERNSATEACARFHFTVIDK